MSATYRTMQGEMVDAICRRVYGDESGYVEAVLDANPGLAVSGVLLPDRTEIALPNTTKAAETVPMVALWD